MPVGDPHDSGGAQVQLPRNEAVGASLLQEAEHSRGEAVGLWTLPGFASEGAPLGLRCGDPGADALPQQVPLEFRQRRHEGGNELALGGAQIELEAGLGDERDIPGLEIVEGLHQVHGAAPPSGEFGNENGVDAAVLGQGQDLLALYGRFELDLEARLELGV